MNLIRRFIVASLLLLIMGCDDVKHGRSTTPPSLAQVNGGTTYQGNPTAEADPTPFPSSISELSWAPTRLMTTGTHNGEPFVAWIETEGGGEAALKIKNLSSQETSALLQLPHERSFDDVRSLQFMNYQRNFVVLFSFVDGAGYIWNGDPHQAPQHLFDASQERDGQFISERISRSSDRLSRSFERSLILVDMMAHTRDRETRLRLDRFGQGSPVDFTGGISESDFALNDVVLFMVQGTHLSFLSLTEAFYNPRNFHVGQVTHLPSSVNILKFGVNSRNVVFILDTQGALYKFDLASDDNPIQLDIPLPDGRLLAVAKGVADLFTVAGENGIVIVTEGHQSQISELRQIQNIQFTDDGLKLLVGTANGLYLISLE